MRLFFGLEVHCPWPEHFPAGKLLSEENRHLTLAFLGDVEEERLLSQLDLVPKPPLCGYVGHFDACLLLPPRHPNVAAWHIAWWEREAELNAYQKALSSWLKELGFTLFEHDRFLPHVTICRKPVDEKKWQKHFHPLPMQTIHLHLYESLGFSQYRSIWHSPVVAPFEEISHTADIAFRISGHSFKQLYLHAASALAFNFPALMPYCSLQQEVSSLDDVVMHLNGAIALADGQIGCPFKAISYHDRLEQTGELLVWNMIVDV